MFPVKVIDILKIEKKNSIDISVFDYENIETQPVYAWKKFCEEKHVDLLLLEGKGNRNYVLIKDFNTIIILYTVEKNFFGVIFTSFWYRGNIKISYYRLLWN